MSERPTIYEVAMRTAREFASRSEDPDRKVGAVALTAKNHVIATGYNGLPSGYSLKELEERWIVAKSQNLGLTFRDFRRPFMQHAEQNLCSLFKKGEVHTVCVTTFPCPSCVGLLVAHEVKRVLYLEDYSTDPLGIEIARVFGLEIGFMGPLVNCSGVTSPKI